MANSLSASQAIGIFPQFFASKQETLLIGEGGLSLTGRKNNFDIALADGTPLLRAESSIYSNTRKVIDANGNHLFDIEKSRTSAFTDVYVKNPNGQMIMEMRNRFSLFGLKGTATFTSQSGKKEVLEMKGGTSSVVFTNLSTGAVVAHLHRKTANLLTGRQQLTLQVMPGVDMALMVALSFEFIKRVMNR